MSLNTDLTGHLNALEELREATMLNVGNLLQRQQWNSNAFVRVVQFIVLEHDGIRRRLAKLRSYQQDDEGKRSVDAVINRCSHLDKVIRLLQTLHNKSSSREVMAIQKIIFGFDSASRTLSQTLIDKNLLDRQNTVLENLIISHEHIANWKLFVQQILKDFHHTFSFDFFFIAFSEDNVLTLFFYYMGCYVADEKERISQDCAGQVLTGLGLAADTPYSVESFEVLEKKKSFINENIETITVQVPEYAPNLAGLLGVTYASAKKITVQERAVIRSILAVMVMVVGSSKVLSKTLAELEFHSVHDPLTGLYNRRYFDEMLSYEFNRSERHQHHFSVIYIDSDDFKRINDSYGHPCGDQVLVQTGEIMRDLTRKGDLVVRMGGDEFAILLPETQTEGARALAENLRKRICNYHFVSPDGEPFQTSISLGVATYPKDGRNAKDLLSACDMALYQAKDSGKNSIAGVDSVDRITQAREARVAVDALRSAMDEGRIVPYFQPIFNTSTREVFAYEVMARKLTNDGKVLSAFKFIDVIEKFGLALNLDRAIITASLHALRRWLDKHPLEYIPLLFINLSPKEIQGRGVLGFAEKLCKELDIAPEQVVFELTERAVVGDMAHMRSFLANLRNRGFKFALDDFGSGYNAFHYLRELRFDFIKIDGEFVRAVTQSKIDAVLVRNLATMCQQLGMQTIAEYVEDETIMEAITAMGINYGQGFHLGAPVSEANALFAQE